MKKLMIAVALLCAATASQAANYNWNAMGSAYWSDSGSYDELDGFKVYAFDAQTVTLEALTASLTTTGAAALEQSMGFGTVGGFEYSFSSADAGNKLLVGYDSPEYVHGYLVLVGDGSDGKSYFAAIDPGAVKVTEAISGSGAPLGQEFVVSALPGAGAEGWTQVASVPEPTSGLLLLLGVAGLALRRRRA